MYLKVRKTKEEIYVVSREARHVSPHLHHALEIVYVTEGAIELGVGEELYHMEKGDIGFVFSDVIHHYQVLMEGDNRITHIIVPLSIAADYADEIQNLAPEDPVLKAENIEPEVYDALHYVLHLQEDEPAVVQAYVRIILARCMKKLKLVDKSSVESEDLVYRAVSYISGNFRKKFSLEDMAKDLGVSKYMLSRIFSKTFHCNFNHYLNEARLGYAVERLENTDRTITEICLDSGFESQRTFNRVFKERYGITPSGYRKGELRAY